MVLLHQSRIGGAPISLLKCHPMLPCGLCAFAHRQRFSVGTQARRLFSRDSSRILKANKEGPAAQEWDMQSVMCKKD